MRAKRSSISFKEAKEKFTEYYNSVIKADTKKEKILILLFKSTHNHPIPYNDYYSQLNTKV